MFVSVSVSVSVFVSVFVLVKHEHMLGWGLGARDHLLGLDWR